MLIWAIFTAGFIFGGILTAFIMDKRSDEPTNIRVSYPQFQANSENTAPEDIHKKLVEVNYFPQSQNSIPENAFQNPKIASLQG
jgi:hypothetical protein